MKNVYVTLFSAFLLGSTRCTGCAEKKTGSSGEVIEMIHKVNGYWQMSLMQRRLHAGRPCDMAASV